MAGSHSVVDITTEKRQLESLAPKLMTPSALVGVVALIVAFITYKSSGVSSEVFYNSYLVSFVYFLSISLGALFFVLVLHLTKAGWGVALRRVGEAVSANMGLMLILTLPLIYGFDHVYADWVHIDDLLGTLFVGDEEHFGHAIHSKTAWLDKPFFIARLLLYIGLWIVLAQFFFKNSKRQDKTGDERISNTMAKWSGPAIILYGLSITFASWDLLMSLRPEWFSTIYGIYFFAGSFMSFMAFLALSNMWLQGKGLLKNAITTEHYHDMGKLMFAFIVFWAYTCFSQYMLQWYANLPEETTWLQAYSWDPEWKPFSFFMLFGHFFVPFLFVLSRWVKRTRLWLFVGATWMLFMHYMDMFWNVMPNIRAFDPGDGHFQAIPMAEGVFWHGVPNAGNEILVHALLFVGIGGLFIASTVYNLRNCSVIAENDPRLTESLAFENF